MTYKEYFTTNISHDHLIEGLEFVYSLSNRVSKCRILSIDKSTYEWIMIKFISDRGITYNLAYGQIKGARVNLSQVRRLKQEIRNQKIASIL